MIDPFRKIENEDSQYKWVNYRAIIILKIMLPPQTARRHSSQTSKGLCLFALLALLSVTALTDGSPDNDNIRNQLPNTPYWQNIADTVFRLNYWRQDLGDLRDYVQDT